MYNTKDKDIKINENLYNANVQLSDKNRELNYDLKEEKRIRKKAIDYILNKSIEYILNKSEEYKPGYRKVDLNTKDCIELLKILENEVYE